MTAIPTVLVALGVLVLAFAVLAAPLALLVPVLRARPGPAAPRGPMPWTDDDEIAARHHH